MLSAISIRDVAGFYVGRWRWRGMGVDANTNRQRDPELHPDGRRTSDVSAHTGYWLRHRTIQRTRDDFP